MNTLLTMSEVAEILNVCYQTIRKLMSDPIEHLFYLRIGSSVRFEKKDVLAIKPK